MWRPPGPAWVRGYERAWLRGDVLAGVTITAYLIPQVMAYAELAGLPATTGLWASVGGLLGYAFLGSSRRLSVGPESTTALMTAAALGSVTGANPEELAAALALVVAVICLLGWVARLGALADLLSRPVLVGYLAGISVIMVVSQLGGLLGVDAHGDSVTEELVSVVRHLDQTQAATAVLGLTTVALLLLGAWRWPRAPVALLGMLGATAVSTLLDLPSHGVAVVGPIASAPPAPGLPDLDGSHVLALLGPALGVAFVAYTDNVLTGRAFAFRHRERVDPHRELLALGAANVGAGLMHGFPVSSSGSRTAIGDAVGGRTQLAALVTVVCAVVAVLALGPVLAAFPLCALSAVVVYAATRIVDLSELARFARFRRSELVLALATLIGVLALGVLRGIVAAIALSVLDLLRRVARPHDAIEGYVPGLAGMHDVDDWPSAEVVPGLLVYRYDSPLFFANAEDFRERALASLAKARTPVQWFLLNTEAIVEIDITALDALESLRAELERRGIVVALARLKQDLRDDLAPTGFLERIGEEHIFATLPTAVAAYLARTEGPGPQDLRT